MRRTAMVWRELGVLALVGGALMAVVAPVASGQDPGQESARRSKERGDSERRAAVWAERSGEGNPEALLEAGRAYATGTGVPKDGEEAVRLFRAAAEQGSADACGELARLLFEGRIVARDPAAAKRWARVGAERGSALAMYLFAVSDFFSLEAGGQGCSDRLPWLQRAAAAGLPEARAELGRLYLFGYCGAKRVADAIELYRSLAEEGCRFACEELAKVYAGHYGGVAPDPLEMVKWTVLASPEYGFAGWDPAVVQAGRRAAEEWKAAHPEVECPMRDGLQLLIDSGGNRPRFSGDSDP